MTKRRRQVLYILLIVSFMLCTQGALALTITSVNAPTSINEGETLNVNFTTDTPTSYRILEEGNEVATTNAYTRQIGYDEAGLLHFTFEANSSITAQRTVEVIDTPLVVTINNPVESDLTSKSIPLAVTTNIPADLCYAVTDDTTHTLTQESPTSYEYNLSLDDGLHDLAVKCKRGEELAEQDLVLNVDTTPPSVTLSPSGTVNDGNLTLRAQTDELATCRYENALLSYAQMHPFPNSVTQNSEIELDVGEGRHTYFVICRDVYGNEAAPKSTTFTLRQAPTATISVEGENPHKAGTYEVTLDVSEELKEPPSLTLTYQGGKETTLALKQESDQQYQGLLIVDEDAGEGVASFSFEGTDLDGVTGTTITDGDLFVVDTIKPEKVTTFKATNGTGGVNLNWYYDGDANTFNLYRATSSGVDYTDYYETLIGDNYFDTDTTGAVRYYYRIAPVDGAGNVGELSNEEWASAAAARYEQITQLNPTLQAGLDNEIRQIEICVLDAEQALENLQDESDKERSGLIRDLGLITEASEATRSLKDTLESLKGLSKKPLSPDEFETSVAALKAQAGAARAKLPLTIDISDKVEYVETPSEAEIDRVVARLGQALSEEARQQYRQEVVSLQDAVAVNVALRDVAIGYADGHSQESTIVTKRLTADTPMQDLFALELLPKAEKAVGLSAKPLILDKDLLRFDLKNGAEATISYELPKTDIAVARGATLILAREPATETASLPETTNEATGGVIGAMLGGQGLLVLFAVIIIVGLLVYYFRLGEESAPPARLPIIAPTSSLSQTIASPQALAMQQEGMTLGGATQGDVMQGGATRQQGGATYLITREDEGIGGLLFKGHALIDQNRYLDALYFYKRSLERFAKERFATPVLKEATRQEIELLHAKLALHKAASEGHDALDAEDPGAVREAMELMRQYAAIVGDDDSALVRKAKGAYQYLYRQHQGLLFEGAREERE